ncbi:MAG: phospholipase D family protein, partial [Thermodesulfobacteriota bacterium]|nr:phospholipase D family protein [Thermodesulfobacteriota bacterium]
SRTLLVSPFLGEDPIRNLLGSGNDNILISREESLDELPEELIQNIEKNCQIYVMDVAAEKPGEMGDEEKSPSPNLTDLSGLHAKLVIFEEGWDAIVLSGSANATKKAWSGENVEFMTQMTGRRSKVGIDSFLGKESQHQSFYSMLRPYKRIEKSKETALSKQLETILENARQTISAAGIQGQITHSPERGYTITLKARASFSFGMDNVLGTCYPISLAANNAQDVASLQKGELLAFVDLSPVGLSTFFAFHLEAQLQKEKAGISFVLNLPVEGMPADRDKMIMRSIISDKDRFVRYLLFLLSEDPHCGAMDNLYLSLLQEKEGAKAGHLFPPLQLLEEMVRAYSRNKEKLDRIARLVDDLKQTEETQSILPEEFDQVWEAFLALRNEEKRFAP